MSTTSLQQASSPTALTTLSGLLNRYKEQIAMALPKHLTAERMIRVALTAVGRNQKLQECNPATIAGCVVQASILGLEPDGILGEAYLVPFYNKKANNNRGGMECQLIVGYQGLLKLVRNTGDLKMIDVQEVCLNDEFDYEKGMEPYLRHKPAMGERGPIQMYWAGAVMINGGTQFEVMTVSDIERHRDRYSKSKDFGPWKDSPEWMFKKTVLRKLAKLLPKSAQAAHAVALDERAEAGLAQRFTVDVPIELHQQSDGSEAPQVEAGAVVQMPQRLSEAQPAAATDAPAASPPPDEKKEKQRLRKVIEKYMKEQGWDENEQNRFLTGEDLLTMSIDRLNEFAEKCK